MKSKQPTPREVLSQNLQTLMKAHPTLKAIKKVADATKDFRLNDEDVHLSNGKVGRIAAGSHTTDIDALYSLAKAFSLEPWQLLVPDLNPERLPALTTTPLLEQIKALVGQKAEADTGEKSPLGENVTETSTFGGGSLHRVAPSLSSAIDAPRKMAAKGKTDGTQRRQDGGVQKPRTRRNT